MFKLPRRSRPLYYQVHFVLSDGSVWQLRAEAFAYHWYGVRIDRNMTREEFTQYLSLLLRQYGLSVSELTFQFSAAQRRGRSLVRHCRITIPPDVCVPAGMATCIQAPRAVQSTPREAG